VEVSPIAGWSCIPTLDFDTLLTTFSRDDRGPEYSIFVGDLGPEVNEFVLVSLFQSRFPSCKSAKIMTDPISGMSRGYGFVRFSDEVDQQRALSEMQGVYCGNRPMRISTATPKNKGGPGGPGGMGMPGAGGPMYPPAMGGPPMPFYGQQQQQQPMNQFTDPNNTTVFVGGLSGYVTEDELRSFFQGFGEITYVKIPPGKGCGFVQFVQRHAAEMAINQMQGYPIGNSRVRLSWGRSQNNSGPAGTPYRPAPPPPIYPSMGMPPSHQYGNFAPMKASLEGDLVEFCRHANQLVVRISVLSKHKQEFSCRLAITISRLSKVCTSEPKSPSLFHVNEQSKNASKRASEPIGLVICGKVFSLPRAVDLYQHALCFGRWTRAWNVWTDGERALLRGLRPQPRCDDIGVLR